MAQEIMFRCDPQPKWLQDYLGEKVMQKLFKRIAMFDFESKKAIGNKYYL